MLTLHPSRFDFLDSFPVPLDDVRRQAGRQGLLDQKECAATTDAEWVAFQHRAWCDELRVYQLQRAYLVACIDAHADPGTGQPPRAPGSWPAIEVRARAELLHLAVTVRAILSDYAGYFGPAAAQAFEAFVLIRAHQAVDVGPLQRVPFAPSEML